MSLLCTIDKSIELLTTRKLTELTVEECLEVLDATSVNDVERLLAKYLKKMMDHPEIRCAERKVLVFMKIRRKIALPRQAIERSIAVSDNVSSGEDPGAPPSTRFQVSYS